MASTIFSNHSRQQRGTALVERLSEALPKGFRFTVYHLSTPPSRTEPLCHAPPDTRPDRTYCENHFLAVAIDAPPQSLSASGIARSPSAVGQVLILGLEIYIFTTAYASTFFVSKADSTGYLQLLDLPKGSPSPIREITSVFVSYLLEQRQRRDCQSVISLFARSQSQYLFPGSVENSGKHVLDDRSLVKWWCRVMNPLLEKSQANGKKGGYGGGRGYLIVPGLNHYEMRAFIPQTRASSSHWVIGHPLEQISHFCQEYDWVPPRCLIPKFPDDPKSRFRDELDEEAAKWKQDVGSWKSVKTLEQFWELMAFRQECSSGRLTGFIWVVFDNKKLGKTASSPTSNLPATSLPTPSASSDSSLRVVQPVTPPRRLVRHGTRTPQCSPLKAANTPSTPNLSPSNPKSKKGKRRVLKGPIIPRQPHVKTHQTNYLTNRPVSTAYYYWPPEGRGQRIVDEPDYKRSIELLLQLDFATVEIAMTSTKRWIDEVGRGSNWGLSVTGKMDPTPWQESGALGSVNNLTSSVKRKRGVEAEANGEAKTVAEEPANKVNVLGAGLIRKKRKDEDGQTTSSGTAGTSSKMKEDGLPEVNLLGGSLVRKKPRAS